jgi:hypothetical protein
MTEVDQYQYESSCRAQSLYKDQPFTDIQYNYVGDINQSSYTNSSLTLIQYDLTSIYNSSRFVDTKDMYLLIPTIRTCAFTNGAAADFIPPAPPSFATTCLKNGNCSIIHQADLIIDGKSITQLTPYSGMLYGINEITKLSKDDLTLRGKTMGYSTQLDNPNSTTFSLGSVANPVYAAGTLPNAANNLPSTPGIANNQPFGIAANNTSAIAVGTTNQSIFGMQNAYTVNGNIQEKISWTNNATLNGQKNRIFGSGTSSAGAPINYIMPINNLNQDFTPYCTIIANTVVWYDYLTIKLSDVFGSMENIGILRKFNAILRLYINTGLITVQAIDNAAGTGKTLQYNGQQYSTFTNVCPLMINSLGLIANYANAAFTDITCGFFIVNTPNYSINTAAGANVNFSGKNIASAITSTRFYYSSLLLDPIKASDYLSSQQSKTVISKEFLFNTYTGIQAGANYSQLVQSGVKNIVAVLILPFISSSQYSVPGAITGFSQYQSPFDPCGGAGCTSPLSLINLQVAVGGVNQLMTTYTYSFQTWLQEIVKYNKSSATEYGVESGLLDFNFWNMNKLYMVNVRSTEDDAQTPRNVTVSFINNSNAPMDIIVYTIYEQEIVVNCATGAVVVK